MDAGGIQSGDRPILTVICDIMEKYSQTDKLDSRENEAKGGGGLRYSKCKQKQANPKVKGDNNYPTKKAVLWSLNVGEF